MDAPQQCQPNIRLGHRIYSTNWQCLCVDMEMCRQGYGKPCTDPSDFQSSSVRLADEPVHADHCFGRYVLQSRILVGSGIVEQWYSVQGGECHLCAGRGGFHALPNIDQRRPNHIGGRHIPLL